MLFGKRERRISRIMIVEDEPLVAFDNENMLQEAGYVVVATVDGFAAARATSVPSPSPLRLMSVSTKSISSDSITEAASAKLSTVATIS